MEEFTVYNLWALMLGAASAIVLLANAAEKIVKAYKAAKAPNIRQDERLDALECWKSEVDRILKRDKEHLSHVDEANRATQRALLALLDHGIDGNNIEQMKRAKEELKDLLISR